MRLERPLEAGTAEAWPLDCGSPGGTPHVCTHPPFLKAWTSIWNEILLQRICLHPTSPQTLSDVATPRDPPQDTACPPQTNKDLLSQLPTAAGPPWHRIHWPGIGRGHSDSLRTLKLWGKRVPCHQHLAWRSGLAPAEANVGKVGDGAEATGTRVRRSDNNNDYWAEGLLSDVSLPHTIPVY